MARPVLAVCCVVFGSLLMPLMDDAQSTFGDIRGTTRDPSGLPLPQAAVTLRNLDDNTSRTETTDDKAGFLFENLKPGHYELSAAKEGFSKSQEAAVELTARQSVRVDLTLLLATVSQAVSVEAAAGQINTENSVIGDTRPTDQLVNMPLNFGAQTTSPLATLALSPNVITDS